MAVYRRSGFSHLFDTPTQSLGADALRLARLRENLVKAKLASTPLSEDLLKDEATYATQARGGQLAHAAQQKAGAQARALEALIRIEEQESQYPGRRMGGSGSTGLLSTDERGYRDLLGQRLNKMDLEAALSGKPKTTFDTSYSEESFPAPFEPLPHPASIVEGEKIAAGGMGTNQIQAIQAAMQRTTSPAEREQYRKILEGLRNAGLSGTPPWSPQGPWR